jgi:FAD/FMN-containing dehydrogenase
MRALTQVARLASEREDLRVATIDTIQIDDALLAALRQSFRGELIRPGDPAYEEQRAVWNGAIDRRPSLIARCTGARDVIEAVRFARERELLVSIRGGGHNIAGLAVWDDALMIDLSPMRTVHVDPHTRSARVRGRAVGRCRP